MANFRICVVVLLLLVTQLPNHPAFGNITPFNKTSDVSCHPENHLLVEYGSLVKALGEPFKIFSKYVRVFGLYVVATEGSPNEKLLHCASVFCQYIDNDSNGIPDNMLVYKKLVSHKATMTMFMDNAESNKHEGFQEKMEAIHQLVQDLEADETIVPGELDTALEECFHLLSAGYSKAYPGIFGYKTDSYLAYCLDKARGGHFEKVPARYPRSAWFTYSDKTCRFKCQAEEYIYWAMSSILGLHTNRRDILNEWHLNTPRLVKEHDPAIYALLTSEIFHLPKKLPQPLQH